jgi:enoyl-CoA hydratase/carnithine racemase
MSQDNMVEKNAIEVSYPEERIALIRIASKPLGVLRFGVKRALEARLKELEDDNHTRCVILTGVERAFSVGSDVKDFSQEVGWLLENDYVEAGLNATIENSPLPIIAACNGYTLGGGAVLALACDIRVASESATFGFPEVKLGAFASGSGTQRLPRLIGRGRALDLLFTGRTIDAVEALEVGLVEYVASDDSLIEKALEIAGLIVENSPSAISATKHCVNIGLREGFNTGLAAEQRLRVETGSAHDAMEGQAAFVKKRKPLFRKE